MRPRLAIKSRPNPIYGAAFLLVALVLCGYALRGRITVFLLWPALSFLIVAVAYFTGRVNLFGKREDGSRHRLSTLFLLPYLSFVDIVWRLQVAVSNEPAAHAVNDSLIVARRLFANEVPRDVSVVCDLTSELCDSISIRSMPGYTCFPILDASAVDPPSLARCVAGLKPGPGTRLLIHCANGHGRTGMVAATWLLAHRYASSIEDALSLLKRARPAISLRRCQRQAIEDALPLLQAGKNA